MNVVPAIFDAFGGVNKLADATGFPQQTVSEWQTRQPPEIPPWRRSSVADAARRGGIALGSEALAYLASHARTPKSRSDAVPQSAAA